HPRAANLVELVARDLDGQRRAQRGAPRLHAADLHVLPTVGQVEVVAVEELVDRDPLDGEALAPLVAALAEDLMELAPGLCFVLHPRIGRVAPAGLAGKLVLEPPIAGELPTAHAPVDDAPGLRGPSGLHAALPSPRGVRNPRGSRSSGR